MKERNRGGSSQLNSSHSSVTQPVGESRNSRRVQQIEALHMQFQDLKKKIKDVETKNQKIIENIHKRYDFKKKPQTMQLVVEKAPIIYYQNLQDKTQLSAQNQSNNSNDSECEFKMPKPIVRKTSNLKKYGKPHQSTEYRKTEVQLEEANSSEIGSNKSGFNPPVKQMSGGPQYNFPTPPNFRGATLGEEQFKTSQYSGMSGMSPYQMPMQFTAFPSMAFSQPEPFYNNSYQFQQNLRRQREKVKVLEKQLQDKQSDSISLKRLQKRYNSLNVSYAETVQNCMEQFMQQVIKKKLYEIEKHVKKNQNKLKRLHLMIKDKDQENRSAKNIAGHRRKRSSSRNKDSSPTNPNYSSLPKGPKKPPTTAQTIPDASSASKSRVSQSKSALKFEQIASQYQQIIKAKNKELEISESRLRQKQKQLIQITTKCAKFELKLSEAEQSPNPLKRTVSSDMEPNLLANLQFQNEKWEEVEQCRKRIRQLQEQAIKRANESKDKDVLISQLNKKLADWQIKSKKYDFETKKLKEQLKKIESVSKQGSELQVKLKRLESDLLAKEKELNLSKQKCTQLESSQIEKECEAFSLANKLKKIQQLLNVREEKIEQLQKIIQSNNTAQSPDLLEKSVYLEKIEHHEVQLLQEQKDKLEEELNAKETENYTLRKNSEALLAKLNEQANQNSSLRKDIETLQIQNESMQINLKAMQFDKYKNNEILKDKESERSAKNDPHTPLHKLLEENDAFSQNQDNSAVREELDQMRCKYEQSQRQLKVQKHESLQFNTKLIKLNSQLNYCRELLTERQSKYEKLKKELEEGKIKINMLTQAVAEKDNQLEVEKEHNNEKIRQLQTQWLEFQEEIRNKELLEGNNSDLKSSRLSEESFMGYKNTFNSINAQNQQLNERLKEAEKFLQIQKQTEAKIISEYRSNVQRIKMELRQKVRQNEELTDELNVMSFRLQTLQKNQKKLNQLKERGDNSREVAANSKVEIMELQLNELREIKGKQEGMEQELFKQIAEKQQQNESLVRLISAKERKIEELQELIELKQMHFSSNISSSQNKSKIKDSLQSNSSLRYSMLSNNNNRTIDFQLSEAGESFYEQNQSMISNVSQVFGRDEFPYQKMHLRRVQQRRLFQKTAAYIKSLKKAIEEKNKKIKLLEKKIESLRNSELIRQDIYDVKECFELEPDDKDVFRDYYSVQNYNTNSQLHKVKQLEHETKLTIEENNLLINQIQELQEELMKSEEQENSLMKLKELYKDEIKTLIKKNQEQAKMFQDELKKERQKVQQSQSVQTMQALKKLFTKIISAITLMEHESSKSKKKEEHKKELEDYIKVLCNFLHFEEGVKDKMLSDFRK